MHFARWFSVAALLAAPAALSAQLSPPFSGTPEALLQQAQGPAPDADAEVLLEDRRISFDAQGCRTTSRHQIVRILRAHGVEEWGTQTVDWQPWHEERPTIRGRVVTPDGVEHPLDPKIAVSDSAISEGREVISDDRQLKVVLPALKEGAVLELEIATRENQPFFAGGYTTRMFGARPDAAVRQVHYLIEAPKQLPLRVEVHGLPAPTHARKGGVERYELLAGPFAMHDVPEEDSVFAEENWPTIAYSTGTSWNDVAQRYAGTIDAQLAHAQLTQAHAEIFGKGSLSPDDAVKAVAAWIRTHVRYTGVELGDAAIVPRAPEETLTRGFGDCKDLATLFVGLLRSGGVDAHVALLQSGWGDEPADGLPGMGLFNHAIVHVDPIDRWVDPTAKDFAPPALPVADQGRRALIANPSTHGLVTTPIVESPARVTIRRELTIPEDGAGTMVERVEYRDALAAEARASFIDAPAKDLNEWFTHRAKEQLRAEKVLSSQVAPSSLAEPFWWELKVDGAAVQRESGKVRVELRTGFLAGWLPDSLRSNKDRPPRRESLLLEVPYVAELHYRLHPPLGFAADSMPPDDTHELGSGKVTFHASSEPDGTVDADIRFESPRRHLSAAEVEAFREALQSWDKSPEPSIQFVDAASRAVASGDLRAGLQAYAARAAQHPTEARHQREWARALLNGGYGTEAQAHARRAVELDPKDVASHRELAWDLEHDAIGRRFGAGWDRAGAIAEYQKAIALAPDDFASHADLAIVEEHDASGHRYLDPTGLKVAIDQYREIHDRLKHHEMDLNWLFALAHAERFDELNQVAPTASTPEKRDGLWTAAIAMTAGVSAAEAHVSADPEQRRKTLSAASALLVGLRDYPQASALLRSARAGATESAALDARAAMLARVQRYQAPAKALRPEDPPRLLLAKIVDGSASPETLRALFSTRLQQAIRLEDLSTALRIGQQLLRSAPGVAELPASVLTDFIEALAQPKVEGNDSAGYRVQLTMANGKPFRAYVVKDGAGYGLLAVEPFVSELGAEAMVRLQEGDEAGARQWLQWEREALGTGTEPLMAFVTFYDRGLGDRAALAQAAALGAAGSSHSKAALEALDSLKDTSEPFASSLQWARAACELALQQPEAAAARLDAVVGAKSDPTGLLLRLAVAAHMKADPSDQKGMLTKLLAAYENREPGNRVLSASRMDLAFRRQQWEEGMKIGEQLVSTGDADAQVYNQLAWYAFVSNHMTDSALDHARRAVEMTNNKDSATLNTLAATYAALGHPREAREVLLKQLALSPGPDLRASEWVIVGEIAEDDGEQQTARAAYAHAMADPQGSDSAALARQRLAALPKP
jgi:hypothetical protein